MPPPSTATMPVFALDAVLFPSGVLPLKVFETRYVDMVRECLRNDSPFVVCRITRGSEVGEPAEHEAIGCLARITEWDMQQPGVLMIRAIGGQRVRVLERSVQRDGLIRARIETIDPDPDLPVPAEYAPCVKLLERLISELAARDIPSFARPIVEPQELDSASWVGNRLCELLPLPIGARQKLMELDDPLLRMSLLLQVLQQRGIG
ncbi:MAG: LON peptidase substrate-binding domain-containing protein [Burkholderiaceae bacterium]